MSILCATKIVLLGLTALMIFEAFSPTTFANVIRVRWIEDLYVAPILGCLMFLALDIRAAMQGRRRGRRSGFVIFGAVSWCAVVFFCCILMAVRTGI
jgi:hypothetical protein